MNIDLAFNYWIVTSLLNIGSWFSHIMLVFTWLGNPQSYMVIIAIIYWSIDRKLGLRMALFLTFSASINSILKQAFHAPRPYWIDARINAIHVSNGFGMPSGHAQASTVWLFIAAWTKSKKFWGLAIAITLLVGLSRIYLGVHFPSQVLAGWIIGILIIILLNRFEFKFALWFKLVKLPYQLLFVSGITLIFVFLGGIFVLISKDWDIPLDWIIKASPYMEGSKESILSSKGMESVISNAGGFLGAAMGGILIDRMGGFNAVGVWWKRLLRSILGLTLILIVYAFFRYFGPDEKRILLFYLWRFIGFFVILFSEIFLAPLLFKNIKLLTN